MKRKTKYIIAVILLSPIVITVLSLYFYYRLPSTYSAEPVAGQIVDAETGKPIEDAIVVAIWELKYGFYIHVKEVLTDKEGFYWIDGWGPKQRPKGAYTDSRSPRLAIFKEGYYPLSKLNSWKGFSDDRKYKKRKVHKSDWHMQTLKLKPFDGDWEQYAKRVSSFNSAFNSLLLFGADKCDWLKIPRMIIALGGHRQLFEEKQLRTMDLPILRQLVRRKQCGVPSVAQFIEEYK